MLGVIYFEKKIKFEKVKEYYEKAVLLNNKHAMNNLGNMYKTGYGNITQNYLRLYEKAILLNSKTSMYNLGHMYEYGVGLKIDLYKAKELYIRAGEEAEDHLYSVNEKIELQEREIELQEREFLNKHKELFKECLFRIHFHPNLERTISENLEKLKTLNWI